MICRGFKAMFPSKHTIPVSSVSHPGYGFLYIMLELTKDHDDFSIQAQMLEIVSLHFMINLAMNRFNEKTSQF